MVTSFSSTMWNAILVASPILQYAKYCNSFRCHFVVFSSRIFGFFLWNLSVWKGINKNNCFGFSWLFFSLTSLIHWAADKIQSCLTFSAQQKTFVPTLLLFDRPKVNIFFQIILKSIYRRRPHFGKIHFVNTKSGTHWAKIDNWTWKKSIGCHFYNFSGQEKILTQKRLVEPTKKCSENHNEKSNQKIGAKVKRKRKLFRTIETFFRLFGFDWFAFRTRIKCKPFLWCGAREWTKNRRHGCATHIFDCNSTKCDDCHWFALFVIDKTVLLLTRTIHDQFYVNMYEVFEEILPFWTGLLNT